MAEEFHALNNDLQSYLILLIITDGEITDMDQTIHEIVNASHLPLSIVIVGVGGANFDKMNILDGDDDPLKSGNKYTERDIVQFVPFRSFQNDPTRLAAAVLEEIPTQFCQYMKRNNITPNQPLSREEQNIIEEQKRLNLSRN